MCRKKTIPGAASLVESLRNDGRRVLFFTNNTTDSHESCAERLCRLGITAVADDVITAGDAAVSYLKRELPHGKIYVLGTKPFQDMLRENGIGILSEEEAATEDGSAVLTAFDTDLTYQRLSNACRMIEHGAPFFGTHPDRCCPCEYGFQPDCGAICACIQACTGVTPRYFGKPEADTLTLLTERFGIGAEQTVMVGDRLYTDIAFGAAQGVTSVLVLTGETTRSQGERATGQEKPDFIFPSVSELEQAMFSR